MASEGTPVPRWSAFGTSRGAAAVGLGRCARCGWPPFPTRDNRLGAVAAALSLVAIFTETQVGAGCEASAAMFAEVIMTFFLMFVVFGPAVDRRGSGRRNPARGPAPGTDATLADIAPALGLIGGMMHN